ncbi:orotidine 5'-phosphate decarboxylase, subfamily 2 [Saccharomonospora marina XMU15]|uniref:Orotidine 5'-phosphate decarboxylase n=1 Tax=Saccharomonospora marina XMU15 TaxID=882083 RepID=H5XAR0_9PSEU|nr:orotidine-5'-phosphate decarboxylase [Saccharomonospora marina]EHR51565.1 orotidine 5'-phosphate decarboxylase, subfamily 2 [Saccharomonospora marina XMU15]
MREAFGKRLADAVSTRGPLCAGVDPHPSLLRDWGLATDASGLERFALTATEAIAEHVAVLKPQSAFFEAHGAAGIAVLQRVIGLAGEAGALVLLDVKRGDIGSTMAAYASAYLGEGSPLAADAITVSPYLGFDSLEPALRQAEATGRGVFVLARTSNPEGERVQRADAGGGRTVAQSVIDAAALRNAGTAPMGHVGVVVGATNEPGQVELTRLNGPILAPGFGAQGATVRDLPLVFGDALPRVLPATSRALLRHGPDPAALRAAVLSVTDQLSQLLG